MRELIQAGEIGDIQRVTWIITDWFRTQQYYDSGSWRATWAGEGGGVLINQCPHQIDLLQWVVGKMPVKVNAFCHYGKWHDIEVEDDVTAYFEYDNGATGVFITTTGEAPGTNRFEVSGTKGKLLCEGGKLFINKNTQDSREFCNDPANTFGSGGKLLGVIPKTAQLLVGDFPLKYDLSNFNEFPYIDYLSPSRFINENWCSTFMCWAKDDIVCQNQGEPMAERVKQYAPYFDFFEVSGIQNNHCFHLEFGHNKLAMECMKKSTDFLKNIFAEETVTA
jgi:hypothetical protein